MQILYYVFIAFAAIAALDRIFGSKLGLGDEFERGISMAGPLVLAMGGMLVLVPVISNLLSGISGASSAFFDLSIIPAALLANDMGASQIAMSLAASPEVGLLNGMVVSSMMGCTVSFLIPYVLQFTDKSRHGDVVFGLLCGIITIPVGVFVSGLIIGVDALPLIFVLLPLLLFAGLLALGILKFENGRLLAEFAVRSSVESAKHALIDKMRAITYLAGGSMEVSGDYPGWKYRKESPLREKMIAVYEEMYGETPKIEAIHAGLECGILGSKIEDLDCVSFGPDMKDIHTTEEVLSVSSTQRVWQYLLRVLATKD
jgi:ethanolamine transporter EutH